MASFGEVCFIFAFLLFAGLGVQGDVSSYRDVCNKTGDNYYFCIDCFEDHQKNDSDYGGISIICTRDSTLIAQKTALEYSNNSTGKFQDVMKFCVPKLDLAAEYFAAALRSWREQRKEDTTEFIDFVSLKEAILSKTNHRAYDKSIKVISVQLQTEDAIKEESTLFKSHKQCS
ncbi:hypothetical protein ACH5RR_003664 [Cinchona calisaya]|uniref:Pectinesterase inhibitor domain-containing protein n=1 Tax=Cinchona calisaya TaxID=153742 RepID=A0ABD3AVX1_9GENT